MTEKLHSFEFRGADGVVRQDPYGRVGRRPDLAAAIAEHHRNECAAKGETVETRIVEMVHLPPEIATKTVTDPDDPKKRRKIDVPDPDKSTHVRVEARAVEGEHGAWKRHSGKKAK